MQVAAVILAAGSSTRFGSPKQLARIGGRTMLEAIAATADEAGLHPLLAVVPSAISVPPGVVPVINDAPEAGLSRSLQLGIRAVPVEADAARSGRGDHPPLDAPRNAEGIAPPAPHNPPPHNPPGPDTAARPRGGA